MAWISLGNQPCLVSLAANPCAYVCISLQDMVLDKFTTTGLSLIKFSFLKIPEEYCKGHHGHIWSHMPLSVSSHPSSSLSCRYLVYLQLLQNSLCLSISSLCHVSSACNMLQNYFSFHLLSSLPLSKAHCNISLMSAFTGLKTKQIYPYHSLCHSLD